MNATEHSPRIAPENRAGCPVAASMVAEVYSRRDPASAAPDRAVRASFGRYCDELRRLNCLTPTQQRVAWLLGELTLKAGFTSIEFESLEKLTMLRPNSRPFAGLGKNDLSLAINGGVKTLANGSVRELLGLVHYGIVRAEVEKMDCQVTVLQVFADSTQWAVPADGWGYAEEELAELLASRRQFTAQLKPLAESPDLHDARAALAAESAANALSSAPTASRQAIAQGRRCDAPSFSSTASPPANAPCRSESQNAKSPAKTGCVPKVGTPLSLKKDLSKELKINLKPCQGEELKDALAMLETTTDNDSVRVALEAILGKAVADNDSGKWINRRRINSGKVCTVMAAVVERICQKNLPPVTRPGGLAETYWQKF